MPVGAFPDDASDSSEDELHEAAMPNSTGREGKALGRSKGVMIQDTKASKAAPASSATRMANGSDAHSNRDRSTHLSQVPPAARSNGGKSVQPNQVVLEPRIPQAKVQPGWLRSGASLFTNLVNQRSDTSEAQQKHGEAQLTELRSKIESLEQKLEGRDSLLLKQGKAHDQYRKDVEAKFKAKLERLEDDHNAKHSELRTECDDELRRLKTAYQRELADRQHQHERRFESAKLETARIIEASSRDAADAHEELGRFRKTCREYEEKLDMQDSTISRMQSAQFKAIEASHWAPLESSEIEGKLSSIQTRVRKWTSDHAMSTLDQVLDPEGFSHSLNELVKRGCVLDPERLRERLLLSKSMRKLGKAAHVLLGAAIMHDIMRNIIANPFFAFLGRPNEPLLGANQAAELIMLVKHIGTYDQAGAEGLRCQILRLLDPPTKDGINNVTGNAKLMARNSRGRAVAELTINIMDGFLVPLQEEERRNAFDGLSGIVEEAAMLSWSFWTRKTVVCALPWARIQSTPPGPLLYDSTSDLLEPHSMHNLLLEDEPQALDGREVVLFCSPALTILGNAEGGEYHKYKVLKKAVVWMG